MGDTIRQIRATQRIPVDDGRINEICLIVMYVIMMYIILLCTCMFMYDEYNYTVYICICKMVDSLMVQVTSVMSVARASHACSLPPSLPPSLPLSQSLSISISQSLSISISLPPR